MAKKKKNKFKKPKEFVTKRNGLIKRIIEEFDGDVIKFITAVTNKKGKVTKLTKKERKQLKAICPHNRYLNERKKIPEHFIRVDDKKMCRCKICGAVFSGKFATKQKVQERTDAFMRDVTQAQFMNCAVGGGHQTTAYLSSLGEGASRFPGIYADLSGAASKKSSAEKKRGRYENDKNDSGALGSWETL